MTISPAKRTKNSTPFVESPGDGQRRAKLPLTRFELLSISGRAALCEAQKRKRKRTEAAPAAAGPHVPDNRRSEGSAVHAQRVAVKSAKKPATLEPFPG